MKWLLYTAVLIGMAGIWASSGNGFALPIIMLIYIVPMLIVGIREKRHPGPVIVVNLLLGWTFIGWVVALAMAFGGDTRKDVTTTA